MKIISNVLGIVCVIVLLSVYGCGGAKPTAANSDEAINQSNNLANVEAKAKYLLEEAKAFINNKQYDDAIKTARHVAENFQEKLADAQKVIQKASVELKKEAEKTMNTMKEKVGSFGQ